MASNYIKNNSYNPNSDDSEDYDKSSDEDMSGKSSSSSSESENGTATAPKTIDSGSDNGSSLMGHLALDESSRDSFADESTSSQSKGKNKDYDFVKTYPSLVAAKEGVSQCEIGGKNWTRSVFYSTNYGDKICYTCRGFPKCPKRMHFVLDTENQDVHVHLSSDDHNHSYVTSRSNPQLNPLSRAKVLELIAVGVVQHRKLLKQLEINNLPPMTSMITRITFEQSML